MMNENYKILGKIIAGLTKDHPPKISRDFSEKVMSRIDTLSSSANDARNTSSNYFNIAASIVVAVVTSMILVNYNSDTNNLVSNDISQPERIENGLIKKVIDEDACSDTDYISNEQEDHACK